MITCLQEGTGKKQVFPGACPDGWVYLHDYRIGVVSEGPNLTWLFLFLILGCALVAELSEVSK